MALINDLVTEKNMDPLMMRIQQSHLRLDAEIARLKSIPKRSAEYIYCTENGENDFVASTKRFAIKPQQITIVVVTF